MMDPELSRYQGELLLRLVRQGPVQVTEIAWQTINVLRKYDLVRVQGQEVAYTTEGLMVAVGLSLWGRAMGQPWRKAS